MKAIFKRELKAYFASPVGYVVVAALLALYGFFYYQVMMIGSSSYISQVFGTMFTFCMMIIPIITMRSMSDERKNKTDQALLTAPVSVTAIVLGKFFAAFTVLMAAVVITLIYIVVISFFGTVNWAETISCYVGFILLCTVVLAIGGFMSSLTDSQIVAAVSTYAVLIVTVFLGNIASAASGVLKTALLWISPTERFLDFAMGILDPSALVYYLSLTVLFLFLTVNVTERRRFS